MREKEIPNDILRMLEVGIGLALSVSFDDDFMTSEEMMTDERVTTILNDETIREDRRGAFAQQTKLGWTRIFTGYISTEWHKSTSELQHKWTSSCIRLFLEWGRACWSHRNLLYTAHLQIDINSAGNDYRTKHEYG